MTDHGWLLGALGPQSIALLFIVILVLSLIGDFSSTTTRNASILDFILNMLCDRRTKNANCKCDADLSHAESAASKECDRISGDGVTPP
jgi:hypothetical protein